jgi:transcriptional regulator with XRE-family HTH domain
MPHNIPHKNMPVNAAISIYSDHELAEYLVRGHNAQMINLRSIRETRGLSQVQLAEMAGVTQGTVSKIERGQMNVTLDKVIAIAHALNVHPATLFDLPELQARAIQAIGAMSQDRQAAALVVLESMARK